MLQRLAECKFSKKYYGWLIFHSETVNTFTYFAYILKKRSESKVRKLSEKGKYLNQHPIAIGHKLNAHKTFRRRPGRLLNFLRTLELITLLRLF